MYLVYMASFWLSMGCRGGFCEKMPEAAPMPNGANSSQLQDRPTAGQTEPISDAGSASVITYLRKAKNCCARASGRDE